jgi:dodecin
LIGLPFSKNAAIRIRPAKHPGCATVELPSPTGARDFVQSADWVPGLRVWFQREKRALNDKDIGEGFIVPEHVYKVVELVGSSEESVTKAIDRAISKAALSVRHLGWFEVVQVRGHIEDGKVAQYQVTIKAGFRLEDT